MAKKEMTNNQVVEILRKEIGGVRDELTDKIGGVRDELKGEISGVRDELKKDIGSARSDLKATEKRLVKKINEDTEFLARITQDGFKEVEAKHRISHKIIRKRIKNAESNDSGTRKIAMSKVERDDGQDIEIKEIKTRVKVLEKQVL